MCFTNVNEAGIRYRYFMYSTNKCADFNKNITLFNNKKKKKKKNSLNILNFVISGLTIWMSIPYLAI